MRNLIIAHWICSLDVSCMFCQSNARKRIIWAIAVNLLEDKSRWLLLKLVHTYKTLSVVPKKLEQIHKTTHTTLQLTHNNLPFNV